MNSEREIMKVRLAFAGFRHGHILEVYDLCRKRRDVEVVAACEEHEPTRAELASAGKVKFTHASYDEMFTEAGFGALAVGDYYARRGAILIRALQAGMHVISDKPICTKLDELERIAELSSAGKLSVGCQLSMRDDGNLLAMRQVVAEGRIGEVHTLCFSGQHPLLRGSRPEWYFQPGKHGGTINDIAIHALDAIGWLTGGKIAAIVAARAWNARVADPDWFQDGAQLMLRLDNDGGVIGDVSYLAPDACGYRVPQYWRFTLHGSGGLAETSTVADGVTVHTQDAKTAQHVPPARAEAAGYLRSFLNEIQGGRENLTLTTQEVLASARLALLAQCAADEGLHDLPCP